MISRSSTFALAFACLATLSVAVAAKVQRAELSRPAAVSQTTMRVIDLPRVVITARTKRDTAI